MVWVSSLFLVWNFCKMNTKLQKEVNVYPQKWSIGHSRASSKQLVRARDEVRLWRPGRRWAHFTWKLKVSIKWRQEGRWRQKDKERVQLHGFITVFYAIFSNQFFCTYYILALCHRLLAFVVSVKFLTLAIISIITFPTHLPLSIKLVVKPIFIFFTCEPQLTWDWILNLHNQHVWRKFTRSCATVPSRHQQRFSLTIWAGVVGDM